MPHLRLLATPAAHEWLARHRLAVSEQGPFLELALPARTTELDRELCAIGAGYPHAEMTFLALLERHHLTCGNRADLRLFVVVSGLI